MIVKYNGRNHCMIFGISFLFSTFFIIIVCGLFKNPIGCNRWNPVFQRYVYPEGYTVRWRQEGYGNSYYGKYGINAIDNADMVDDLKIVLWGDSYVEALHVSDDKKIAFYLNDMMREDDFGYLAINLGGAGQQFTHYYYQIQAYEKILTNVKHHFIIIAGLKDIMPRSIVDTKERSDPVVMMNTSLHFVKGNRPPIDYDQFQKRVWLASLRLQFLKLIYNEIMGSRKEKKKPLWQRVRFSLGPQRVKCPKENVNVAEDKGLSRFWEQLFTEFQTATSNPITIVYVGGGPNIKNNAVFFEDAYADKVKILENVCRKVGFGFMHMHDGFTELFKKSTQLPRGFHNTFPGRGHLNQYGQKAIAKEIFDYCKEEVFFK